MSSPRLICAKPLSARRFAAKPAIAQTMLPQCSRRQCQAQCAVRGVRCAVCGWCSMLLRAACVKRRVVSLVF